VSERAHSKTEISVLRRKWHARKRKPGRPNVLVPLFCQNAFGTVHGRRGGHQQYSQSYQWIIVISRIGP
jgi:hypothetical protein